MTKEELKKEAEAKYCIGCKLRTEQCLWAWRKVNGLNEPNEKNCSCKEVPAYLACAEPREKRIEELEAEVKEWKDKADLWCKTANLKDHNIMINKELEKENAELRKVAEFQQSSNINKYFENKKLKEGLAVGSTFNKALNSMNKTLEEERDKYRNMVFDKDEQLTKAKDHIKKLLDCLKQDTNDPQTNYYVCQYMDKAEQFLNSEVVK